MGLIDKMINHEPDMSSFFDRLDFGHSGEFTGKIAFDFNIIENAGVIIPPAVDKNNKQSKDINAINGDLYFFHPYTLQLQFVDVKCTNFLTDYSVKKFRPDGWYLFNAFVLSKGMQYFMIRNNSAFYEYIQQYSKIITRGEIQFKAYFINFCDLPADPKSIGLELYEYMDSYKYKKLIMDIRTEYDLAGLPFKDIIKQVP